MSTHDLTQSRPPGKAKHDRRAAESIVSARLAGVLYLIIIAFGIVAEVVQAVSAENSVLPRFRADF